MSETMAEKLFKAIDIIAQKRMNDLSYDQTVICTITDISNAEKGKYIVTDGTSTFEVRSDNPKYGLNSQVYVVIPNGDINNDKYISGQYISDENGDYVTYISPMDSFLDLTGDITNETLMDTMGTNAEKGLLANDPKELTKFVWRSGTLNYRNNTCLGIQADFTTLFNGADVTSGNYGLVIYVNYAMDKEKARTGTIALYFDATDMFGDPYHFTTGYRQEKLFDISEFDIITGIEVQMFQASDFKTSTGEDYPYQENGIKFPNNIFVDNLQIRLGELITAYKDDVVKLICNDKMSYRKNSAPLERTIYTRWVHKVDDKLYVIDSNEDMDLVDGLSYVDKNGIKHPNYKFHWYRRKLANNIVDPIAGSFWQEEGPADSDFRRTIIPLDTVQTDKFKVIVEYPIKAVQKQQILDGLDETYNSYYTELEAQLKTSGSWVNVQKVIAGFLEPTEEFDTKAAEDLYNLLVTDRDTYPSTYENAAFADIVNYIRTTLTVAYYSSDQLEFENEDRVEMENLDLVQGLQIAVDAGADGLNGVYRLYDETNAIINNAEARKSRTLTATYTSLATGDTSLTQAEEILWCIPLDNTMIQPPQEDIEYLPKNGDLYFETDSLKDAATIAAEQQNRKDYMKEHRPDTYQKDMESSMAVLEDAMRDDISKISSTTGTTAYENALKAIQDYYKQAMAYILAKDYENYFVGFSDIKYAVIRRQGAELIAADEQLIEVNQTFRIKNYYVESATNNTIWCLVKKFGRIYQASATLHFGTCGTSGTEATLILTMCDANNREISALTYGDSVTIVPYLYDYNNVPLPIEKIGYKWHTKPAVDGAITISSTGIYGTLQSHDNYSMLDHAHAILQVEVPYTITKPTTDASGNETETSRTVTLTAYLPIPTRADDDFDHISGANKIAYDSNGANPSYYKDPYTLYSTVARGAIESRWELYGTTTELERSASRRYYPSISEDGALLATVMYYNGLSPISVVGYTPSGEDDEDIAWVQPILIFQNKYGSAMMNDWDGTLQIDEDNGTILSAMVGAGIKNEDNTFSGALMGNVALADEKIGNKTGIGLYGFDHGQQSFGLNVDGTAFFGKAGHGRIEFDGNKGTIQSYNYSKPSSSQNGTGLQIDLDDSTISAYGDTGSVLINTNQYGSPLFVIRGAATESNTKGNILFYVSSSAYDPGTDKQYDAQYYLQSANYDRQDPADESLTNYSTGALFDLENGRLDVHGKAGRVSIHGDGDTDLFQIKGWKTDSVSGKLIKNTLMNVSPNKHYLQSLDYVANQRGFKLDLTNGRISASGFSLKAGNETTGMIQINTNGAPYLSVTSGTDYVEETDDSGNTIYCYYDAIDLADVSAQFVYDPTGSITGRATVYYVKNPRESGYYGLDAYWGTQVRTLTNPDAEDAKTQWYYTYNPNTNTYSKVNGKMWSEDTWCWATSRLPDQPRIYYIKDAPIGLDDTAFYRDDVYYYLDAAGQYDITSQMRDPANVYNFKAMRDQGKLYKQAKEPLPAAGTEFVEGRIYYEKNADGEYVQVQHIAKNQTEYAKWESGLYYLRYSFSPTGYYLCSTLAFAGAQTYYVPKDATRVKDHKYTKDELLTLTDDNFRESPKTIVHPNTYFYDTTGPDKKTLYYYSNEWVPVEKNETQDLNTYRYGVKFSTTVLTSYDIVDDNVPIYAPNKYYVRDPANFTYEEMTTWKQLSCTGSDAKNYYYYLWYDLYVKCKKVIKEENDTNGYVFAPNKYYEYVSNKPYIVAQEFDSSETYYTNATGSTTITLCDLNAQPYNKVRLFQTTYNLTYDDNANIRSKQLVYLTSDGAWANDTGHFIPGAEYYIKYIYSSSPETWSNKASVKLINITKSRFELKSHNWNEHNQTGMHFYLSSQSKDDYVQVESGSLTNDDAGTATTMELDKNRTYKVGGGYIRGYGYYINSAGQAQFPQFILDWRAGGSHYPIDVNSGAFRVWWNGRVDARDIYAYSGRIGRWYINNNGIYSFNPRPGATTGKKGVALVAFGMDRPANGKDVFTVPNTKTPQTVNNTNLRITVGQFAITTKTTSGEIDEDGDTTSIEFTTAELDQPGFAVYDNGLMVAYGAIIRAGEFTNATIKNASIDQGTIKNVNIEDAAIKRGTITNAKIKSASVGKLTGGTITGATIKGGTITGATIEATGLIKCGGLEVGGKSYTAQDVSDITFLQETSSGQDHRLLNKATKFTATSTSESTTTLSGGVKNKGQMTVHFRSMGNAGGVSVSGIEAYVSEHGHGDTFEATTTTTTTTEVTTDDTYFAIKKLTLKMNLLANSISTS